MNKIFKIMLLASFSGFASAQTCFNQECSIPLAGNAFANQPEADDALAENLKIKNWSDPKISYNCYFKAESAGHALASIKINHQGKEACEVKIQALDKTYVIDVLPGEKDYLIGNLSLDKAQYVKFQLQISKGSALLDIENIDIKSNDFSIKPSYVLNNLGRYFYWGRRGPSVHLQYQIPEKEQVEWFYNELQIPVGYDNIGTYAMANGFGEGYFGMQVNSETERRILFSVWSPFVTDNPNDIPEEERTKVLKKGEKVNTGAFGHEGSGGQSYLIYPWKAGQSYCFLNTAKPNPENNSTTYTAYFKAKTDEKWQLIASFQRPKTNTYLSRSHSFLENFIMKTSQKPRQAMYTNQWYRNAQGEWHEVTQAKFTIDRTARLGYRKDHACDVTDNYFRLKNCGFINESMPMGTMLSRESKAAPVIDFSQLP